MLAFGLLVALGIALSTASLTAISGLETNIDQAYNIDCRKMELVGIISTSAAEMGAMERGLLRRAEHGDAAKVTARGKSFDDTAAKLRSALEEAKPLMRTAKGRLMTDSIETTLSGWLPNHNEFYRLLIAGKTEDAERLMDDKILPAAAALDQSAEELVEYNRKVNDGVQERTETAVARNRWITGAIVALTLLMGFLGMIVVRRVNRELRQAIEELGAGVGQIASAASEVSSTSQLLAQGASNQMSSIEETSASSEEINSMAQKNSQNSEAAAELMGQSKTRFDQASTALGQMVSAMREIKTSSDSIAKIIKVIDEIAFQTNILALNAAVEAARAGEAGMGFAVVAEEVRNLAHRSAQAAQDTASLIEDSIAKSTRGQQQVDHVASAINAVTSDIQQVKILVDEVSAGSQEQARGTEQIGRAMSQMEQLTQQTASSSEEGAAAAEQLNAQSQAMQGIVERLATLVGKA